MLLSTAKNHSVNYHCIIGLLDLSAAFRTIKHLILLHQLGIGYGVECFSISIGCPTCLNDTNISEDSH